MRKPIARRKVEKHQEIDHEFIMHVFVILSVTFVAMCGAYFFSQWQAEMRIPANRAYRISVN